MYNTDSHMSRDFTKDKNCLSSEDEYEEISSAESTALTNELFPPQRSVHFILDERDSGKMTPHPSSGKERKELHNHNERSRPPFQIPTILINVEPCDDNSNVVEPPCNAKEISNTFENNNHLNINYNNANLLHPNGFANRPNSANERTQEEEDSPTFEELTGGLHPITSQDRRNTLYFNDGIRRIDMILVYEEEDFSKGVLNEAESLRIEQRRKFQESLIQEGLELEIEDKEVNLIIVMHVVVAINGLTWNTWQTSIVASTREDGQKMLLSRIGRFTIAYFS